MTRLLLVIYFITLTLGDLAVATVDTSPYLSSSDDAVCLESDPSSCSDNDDYEDDYEYRESSTGEERPVWWNYSIDELFEKLFACGDITYGYQIGDDAASSDPTSEGELRKIRQQWTALREKYAAEVDLVPVRAPTSDNDYSVMTVPVRVGDAGPGKGRGVFARARIAKGALVTNLEAGNLGLFKEGRAWRRFVATLPRETACNFIEWCWIQDVPPAREGDDDVRNGLGIFVAFDLSNLINAADWDDGLEANVRCGRPREERGAPSSGDGQEAPDGDTEDSRGPCRFEYYATRDIEAEEEILINYSEFEDPDQHHWTELGL